MSDDTKKAELRPSAQILEFSGVTRLDLDASRILAKAAEAGLKSVVIVGFDEAGEFYFAASSADGPSVLWDLEVAKKKLLEISVE